MKTELTIEESARLIELGVDAKLASYERYEDTGRKHCGIELPPEIRPIFGLTDILSILPKEIKEGVTTFHLNIDFPLPNQVAARYIDPDNVDNDVLGEMCDELIDALNALLINVIKCGHLEIDKK